MGTFSSMNLIITLLLYSSGCVLMSAFSNSLSSLMICCAFSLAAVSSSPLLFDLRSFSTFQHWLEILRNSRCKETSKSFNVHTQAALCTQKITVPLSVPLLGTTMVELPIRVVGFVIEVPSVFWKMAFYGTYVFHFSLRTSYSIQLSLLCLSQHRRRTG